jgi:hypothetical protein
MKHTKPHSTISFGFHRSKPITLSPAAWNDLRRVIAEQLLLPGSHLCEGIKYVRRQRCPVISLTLFREALGGPRVYASVPLSFGRQIIWSSVIA